MAKTMRKKLLLGLFAGAMTLCAIAGFAGCKEKHPAGSDNTGDTGDANGSGGHNHAYTQEVAESKYLKSEATCIQEALYYKSCSCGEHGTATFKYGELSSHTYDINDQCSVCHTLWNYTEGLQYTLNPEKDSYAVSAPVSASGIVVIPHFYQGLPVTHIKNVAFAGCGRITRITIPNSVTNVGEESFVACGRLAGIIVERGNPNYHSDGNCLIETQTKTLIAGCKESVIPADGSVTIIGENAFKNCDTLAGIIIPEGVTSIEYQAFSSCNGLASIIISDSVTSIGERAFAYCSSLISAAIGNGVTRIESSAFNGCSSLTSVTMGSSVTNIGSWAFASCSSLTEITIPNSVTNIANRAFASCSSLTEITIPDSVTRIESDTFAECSSLTSVTIGSGVTSIGQTAFQHCSALTSIIFHGTKAEWNAIDKAEAWDFRTGNYTVNCTDGELPVPVKGTPGLKYTLSDDGTYYIASGMGTCTAAEIVIGNTYQNLPVLEIGKYAFGHQEQLTSVTISIGIISIGDMAFYRCNALTSVMLDSSVTNIGNSAFAYCGRLAEITIPNSVTSIAAGAFHSCTSLMSVTMGSSVTGIGRLAFHSCSSLTSITIPNGVTRIEDMTFYGCSELTSVTFGSNVESIGLMAFWGCHGLVEIALPNSVTSIGEMAFYRCDALTSVRLGNSLKSIANQAFDGCSELTTIEFQGTKAEWNAIDKAEDWDIWTATYTVQCTDGTIDKNGNEIE